MGRPRAPELVKLICGLLGGDADLLRRARQLLVRKFGPIDAESEIWPFTQTDYYQDEMGRELKRQFVAFEKLIRPDQLADTKLETNAMETLIAEQCALFDVARPVNLDPGYVDLGKLVLATTKDRAHRIYLANGIYAEVTLQFTQAGWIPGAWTYTDYREDRYHPFLTAARQRLHDYRIAVQHLPGYETADEPAAGTEVFGEPIPFDSLEPGEPRSS